MTIPKLPEFPEFPKGAFTTKGPVKPSTILKKPKILKKPLQRIQRQPRIPQKQRIPQPRKIQRKVPRSIKERYVCPGPSPMPGGPLSECVAACPSEPSAYQTCLNECVNCWPPTSANTPWPNGVTMPFGKCIDGVNASPASICQSGCCGEAHPGGPNICSLCPNFFQERYVCPGTSLSECAALCPSEPTAYQKCLNECVNCWPPSRANTPLPNGVIMPFGKCIDNVHASPASWCQSGCCFGSSPPFLPACARCPTFFHEKTNYNVREM